jgi:beta-N-acetylhexosaminidase
MSNLIGQSFITGITGTSLLDEERQFLEKENIGGVILFTDNYESPAQLAELINEIQKCRNEYPLFISVDHEGGRVIRFKQDFIQFPAMLKLSRLDSPKLVFSAAKIMAEELTAVGVNLNFSPVCDILTNPDNKVIGDRAFGEDEETVSKYVSSVIRGFQTNGLIACAKHFPGHGGTTKDSHFDLPLVKDSLDSLREREFQPFIKSIKSRVEFLMMAHLRVDCIDEDLPTTLSKKAYDIIRDELRFNKIIISDDMEMGAIEKHFTAGEAGIMALNAGADIIQYRSFAKTKEVYEAVQEAIKTKKIKNSDISDKFNRIQEVKKQYLSTYNPIYIPEITKKINTAANQKFLSDLLEKIESTTT